MLKNQITDFLRLNTYSSVRGQSISLTGATITGDNDGDAIEVNNAEFLNIEWPRSFTMANGCISIRMKNVTAPHAEGRLFAGYTVGNFELYRNSSDTSILFNMNSTGTTFSSTPNIWDGALHRITVAWFSGYARLLVDGSYDTTSANARSNTTFSGPCHIGNRYDGNRQANSRFYSVVYMDGYDPHFVEQLHRDHEFAFENIDLEYEGETFWQGVYLQSAPVAIVVNHLRQQGVL